MCKSKQPSTEGVAFFERFREHFDDEREPEQKLFSQND